MFSFPYQHYAILMPGLIIYTCLMWTFRAGCYRTCLSWPQVEGKSKKKCSQKSRLSTMQSERDVLGKVICQVFNAYCQFFCPGQIGWTLAGVS